MDRFEEIDKLHALLASKNPKGVVLDLAVLQEGRPYHIGTIAPVVGASQLVRLKGGLLVRSDSQMSPLDYMGVYLVIGDYLQGEELGLSSTSLRDVIIDSTVPLLGKMNVIRLLAILNMIGRRPEELELLTRDFLASLAPLPRERCTNALRAGPDKRVLLTRQGVLAALRCALANPDNSESSAESSTIMTRTIWYVHAVASNLAAEPPSDGSRIGGLPAHLSAELVRNGAFYESDDVYSSIGRQVCLWRTFGRAGAPYLDGKDPADVVAEITGLQIEDFLTLGFALQAHALSWKPGKPLHLAEAIGNIDPTVLEAFLQLVALTPEEFEVALSIPPRSTWDFLSIQEHPVLRTPQGLLVLDESYLFARVTRGLYWIVHDFLRDERGDLARRKWTQAWGAMVEAMSESIILSFAPRLFTGGSTFFTESDLRDAFPRSKAADAVVDFGESLAAFEVVSGQLTTGTRIDGSAEAFEADMNRLVYKKMRQLNATAANLIRDEHPLTGYQGLARCVYPIIVVGGGFVLSPIVATCIEEHRHQRAYFEHALVKPLSVIDLAELEELEGLAATGTNILDVLDSWHQSGIASLPLHNWMFKEYGWSPELYRAPRLRGLVDETFAMMTSRMGLQEERPHEAGRH
jgi:hypothetical protein